MHSSVLSQSSSENNEILEESNDQHNFEDN